MPSASVGEAYGRDLILKGDTGDGELAPVFEE
jgi:hypothetical protein